MYKLLYWDTKTREDRLGKVDSTFADKLFLTVMISLFVSIVLFNTFRTI